MNKQKLPNEILDLILSKSVSSALVRNFPNSMSKKNKAKMTLCSEIIKTGKLSEVKGLQLLGVKCIRADMFAAARLGHSDIVGWMTKNHPGNFINYQDLMRESFQHSNTKGFKTLYPFARLSRRDYFDLLEHFVRNSQEDTSRFLLKNARVKDISLKELFKYRINEFSFYTHPEIKKEMKLLKRIGYKITGKDLLFFKQILKKPGNEHLSIQTFIV